MREHYIGYQMLFAVGATSTASSDARREAQLRHEFQQAVPASSSLEVSVLKLYRKQTRAGTELHFGLIEQPITAQLELLPPPGHSGSGQASALDPFQRDVARLTSEIGNLNNRLVLAASPVWTSDELRRDSPESEAVRNLRQLFGRRARKLILPTPKGELVVPLDPKPKHLPTSEIVTIAGKVKSLPPRAVELGQTQVVEDARGQHWNHVLRQLPLPQICFASRAKGLLSEDVLSLVKAMDGNFRIRLKAKISYDWATGEVSKVLVV